MASPQHPRNGCEFSSRVLLIEGFIVIPKTQLVTMHVVGLLLESRTASRPDDSEVNYYAATLASLAAKGPSSLYDFGLGAISSIRVVDAPLMRQISVSS